MPRYAQPRPLAKLLLPTVVASWLRLPGDS
jgi:hypothetical protein